MLPLIDALMRESPSPAFVGPAKGMELSKSRRVNMTPQPITVGQVAVGLRPLGGGFLPFHLALGGAWGLGQRLGVGLPAIGEPFGRVRWAFCRAPSGAFLGRCALPAVLRDRDEAGVDEYGLHVNDSPLPSACRGASEADREADLALAPMEAELHLCRGAEPRQAV